MILALPTRLPKSAAADTEADAGELVLSDGGVLSVITSRIGRPTALERFWIPVLCVSALAATYVSRSSERGPFASQLFVANLRLTQSRGSNGPNGRIGSLADVA